MSKWAHCLQLCSSRLHRGHCAEKLIPVGKIIAQEAQRTTSRLPGITGVRGPKVSTFLAGLCSDRSESRPESIYPRCLYFLDIPIPFFEKVQPLIRAWVTPASMIPRESLAANKKKRVANKLDRLFARKISGYSAFERRSGGRSGQGCALGP